MINILIIINTLFLAFLILYLFVYKKYKKTNDNLLSRYDNVYDGKKKASPYYISINNLNDFDSDVVLFGHNKRLLSENFGSDKGVKVETFINSSYLQLLNQSNSEPFSCEYIRIHSNELDLSTVIELESSNANGQSCLIPIKLKDYFSPMQFQSNIIDVNTPIIIDGNTEIRFKLKKKTNITLTLFPSERVNLSRVLKGNSIGVSYAKYTDSIHPILLSFSKNKESIKNKIKNKLNVLFVKIKTLLKKNKIKSTVA